MFVLSINRAFSCTCYILYVDVADVDTGLGAETSFVWPKRLS